MIAGDTDRVAWPCDQGTSRGRVSQLTENSNKIGSPTGNRASDAGLDLSKVSELAKSENHHILLDGCQWSVVSGPLLNACACTRLAVDGIRLLRRTTNSGQLTRLGCQVSTLFGAIQFLSVRCIAWQRVGARAWRRDRNQSFARYLSRVQRRFQPHCENRTQSGSGGRLCIIGYAI